MIVGKSADRMGSADKDGHKYWLMKSEPSEYSIQRLQKEKRTLWEGVRNHQAKNFMMKDMQVGDKVIFYHSNAKPSPAAVGMARVSKAAVPDPSQFIRGGKYEERKASAEKPVWYCVEVEYEGTFEREVTLDEMRKHGESGGRLAGIMVIKKGARLSIQPVTKGQYEFIVELGMTPWRSQEEAGEKFKETDSEQ
jgi:predicted RNA-binding protein with PUA-like domain